MLCDIPLREYPSIKEIVTVRLEVGTTAVRMLRHSRLCWSVLFAVMPLAQTGLAQEIPGLACIVGVNGNTGPVYNLHKLSDGAVLIVAQKGWFLAREANDTVAVAPAKDNTETYPRADQPQLSSAHATAELSPACMISEAGAR